MLHDTPSVALGYTDSGYVDPSGLQHEIPVLLSELGSVFINSFVSDQNWSYRSWDDDDQKVAKFKKESAVNGIPSYRADQPGGALCQPEECAYMQSVIVSAMRSVIQCVEYSPFVTQVPSE